MNEQLYNLWHQATIARHNLIELSQNYDRKFQRDRIARIIERMADREARRWFGLVRA